jgi:hypothetical protein
MGARPLKKGAMTPLLRKKGVPAKKIIPKCPDRVFLWYQFGKYQKIPTKYQPKIPYRHTTLKVKGCLDLTRNKIWLASRFSKIKKPNKNVSKKLCTGNQSVIAGVCIST